MPKEPLPPPNDGPTAPRRSAPDDTGPREIPVATLPTPLRTRPLGPGMIFPAVEAIAPIPLAAPLSNFLRNPLPPFPPTEALFGPGRDCRLLRRRLN